MLKKAFLLEIGTEEIPARFMEAALSALKETACEELRAARLMHSEVSVFGTPRRLALLVAGVDERQQDLQEKKKGPSLAAAFSPDGQPTGAARGFARSQGVEVSELFIEQVDGVDYVFAVRYVPGRPALEILPALCKRLIKRLSFPRPMFWYSRDMRFARPIRWLCSLYGSDAVQFCYAGLQSGRVTYGHRFLAPGEIVLASPEEYVEVLRKHYVIADPAERRHLIAAQVETAAAELGGRPLLDRELLDEVNYLVEYPKAVWGSFDREYLEIPYEVPVTVMRAHQRYFPVFDHSGKLLPYFITISNGTRDEFLHNVRTGNERVLRARLADARFFFEEDRKIPLVAYVDRLENIVFMEHLGSMREKARRLVQIAAALADELNLPSGIKEAAIRAAYLAKADLTTHMVYEFPELQGTMGKHYALLSGESEAVAEAIGEHYAPRYAGDRVAQSLAGAIVALADKLDTLSACFGLGLLPSGSQDPYALRRSALGIVATLQAHAFALPLSRLAQIGAAALSDRIPRPAVEVAKEVHDFLLQRVRFLFAESGLRYDVIEAALGSMADDLPGLSARAALLQEKLDTPELNNILTPFTRVANLTRDFQGAKVNKQYFAYGAEHELDQASNKALADAIRFASAGDFDAVFATLMPLQPYIDRFFNEVMVMVDDAAVRENRLALLDQVKQVFYVLGDLSKIVQEKK